MHNPKRVFVSLSLSFHEGDSANTPNDRWNGGLARLLTERSVGGISGAVASGRDAGALGFAG